MRCPLRRPLPFDLLVSKSIRNILPGVSVVSEARGHLFPNPQPRYAMNSEHGDPQNHELPGATSVLAVCAHPDDESFGLGATLATFAAAGSSTTVLCFTHGEATTLGADISALGGVRATERSDAAAELGVH